MGWKRCVMALLLLAGWGAVAMAATKIPVVLSTDVGNEIDDQWAITYLLTQPTFEVRGILSAQAPSFPAPSAHRTFGVLQDVVEHRLGLKDHPPLLEGASEPLKDGHSPQVSAAAKFLVEASKPFSASNRLNVVVIGAATDMASALLLDPTLAERVRVVAMAFKNFKSDGAHEYNEQNDPEAWRLLLASKVPLVVGTGDVCTKYLSLSYHQAEAMLHDKGPVAAWLWSDYQDWYYRAVKPLRVNDFSKGWVIWDIITLAYLRGLATAETLPRPLLDADMNFKEQVSTESQPPTLQAINFVDSDKLWAEFLRGIQP